MFNMVVLLYIILHSSKYSINTVKKPSHNVYFQHWAFFVSVEGESERKRKKKTSALPTSRDKTKKYNDSNKELLQTLGLNNGTA